MLARSSGAENTDSLAEEIVTIPLLSCKIVLVRPLTSLFGK